MLAGPAGRALECFEHDCHGRRSAVALNLDGRNRGVQHCGDHFVAEPGAHSAQEEPSGGAVFKRQCGVRSENTADCLDRPRSPDPYHGDCAAAGGCQNAEERTFV